MKCECKISRVDTILQVRINKAKEQVPLQKLWIFGAKNYSIAD